MSRGQVFLGYFVWGDKIRGGQKILLQRYSNFEGSRGPIGRTFSTSELSLMTLGCFRVGRANFFFGPTFDLENFPTSGVKGRVLLEATPSVGHLLLQLR